MCACVFVILFVLVATSQISAHVRESAGFTKATKATKDKGQKGSFVLPSVRLLHLPSALLAFFFIARGFR